MNVYKSPLTPISNDARYKIFLENIFDTSENQCQYDLLSSIDFNLLTKSNNDIDLNSVKKILSDLLILLNSGMPLTNFPNYLIARVIDLSLFFNNDQDLQNFSIKFIYFLCILDDNACSHYINEIVIEYLFKIVGLFINFDNVTLSLYCLSNFTNNQKPKTNNKIDGLMVLQRIIQFLNLINSNLNYQNQLKNPNIISLSFDIISNCMILYDLNSEITDFLIHQLIQYLNSPNQNKEKDEIKEKSQRIWQISSIQTISKIIFSKQDYKKYFMNNETIDLLINLILSENTFELETLAIHSFCAIDNLSFKNDTFSLFFVSHKPSIFFYTPPEEWGTKVKSHFCRSIISSVRCISECRKLNQGGDLLDQSMRILRESAPSLIPLLINYIETQEFKLRKVATIVLCQFINLNDSSIFPIVTVGHKELIEDFILMLNDNMNDKFLDSLIQSLRTLCHFGETQSKETGFRIRNCFLEMILSLNIDDALNNCEANNSGSTELIKSINSFRRDIENLKRFFEIDLEQEEEQFEIDLWS